MSEGEDWTQAENAAIVLSYLWMLKQELAGIPYVKTHEISRLQETGLDRTSGSIQFKYQNISAVLSQNGWIFVNGYKPAHNIQSSLRDEVLRQLRGDADLDDLMKNRIKFLIESAIAFVPPGLQLNVVDPPRIEPDSVPSNPWLPPEVGLKRDYASRDAKNRELGLNGEKAVVEYERLRLQMSGRSDLADRVVHASIELGDGLGYDVHSFEDDGTDRYIEVKTTIRNKETPFFVSRTEFEASRHYRDQFFLYRIFGYGTATLCMYQLRGPLSESCLLTPDTYLGLPRSDC